jgi:chaperone BCS1
VRTNFDMIPSPGTHFIKYKRTWVQVVREREKSMIDLNSGTPWETVTLTTVGRSHAIFQELLEEAKTMALKKEVGKTVIYSSMGPEWRPFGRPRRRRPLDSVILKAGLADRLLADVQEFSKSQAWYVDRGIPYRRGYLLHGPPGCGKSSFIMALAGALEYNICILNLNERGLTDDKLNMLLSVAPPRSIILLEDVDAAFAKREAKEMAYTVTFSGLLNCLDGVASTEERIVFMTTNHIDRLDPALIRPGRVDVKAEIGEADEGQVYSMFKRFYPDHLELVGDFTSSSAALSMSMAHLQGIFLMHKDDPHQALEHLRTMQGDAEGRLVPDADTLPPANQASGI